MSIKRSAEDLAADVAPIMRRFLGAARRYAVEFTSGVKWVLRGHDKVSERLEAEVFGNLGSFSRPPADASTKPEVISLNIAGSRHPVIIASRDERALRLVRDALGGAIPADSAGIHNTAAMVYVAPGGTIEARTLGGVAQPLVTEAGWNALRDALASWTPVANDGGLALKTALETAFGVGLVDWPEPTSALRGE